MVGDATRDLPKLSRQNTTETFLFHSQSPSFATEPRSQEKLNKSRNMAGNLYVGLVIRGGKDQKRQKPTSPIKFEEPEAKKAKGDGCGGKFEKSDKETTQLEREYAERLSKLLHSNLDIKEMYRALRPLALSIPCPQSLLSSDSPLSDSPDLPNKCSVEDRQNAILKLFALRFTLKLSSETLHLGAALLDMCLEMMLVNEEAVEDLAAVTMVIASKVEEVACLTIKEVIDCALVENKTIHMIRLLERMVLTTLQFEVTVPTPFTFATYLLVHLDAAPTKFSMTSYLLELALLDVENRRHPSDVVAHAATCLAFAIEGETGKSALKTLHDVEIKLEKFCGIEMANRRSRKLMQTLAGEFLEAPTINHTIFREFATQRNQTVSMHPFNEELQKILKIEITMETTQELSSADGD